MTSYARGGGTPLSVCACAGTVAAALATANCPGVFIEEGEYKLDNHPFADETPPGYGLRLDELFDINPGEHDVFTFSFAEADGADMRLTYDGSFIHIFGTAFGGLDTGNGYDPEHSSFITVDFTFENVEIAEPDDDLIVRAVNGPNTGYISWLATNEVINLYDHPDDEGVKFRFGDEDDNMGHRGFEGISGWGWMNHHDPDVHVEASDWIFTATLIPGPSALAGGAALLLVVRRRRPPRTIHHGGRRRVTDGE